MHRKGFASVALSVVATAAFAAGVTEETPVWPSSEAEIRAQNDSTLAFAADGAAEVRTGTRYSWPGLRVDFRSGERDLSAYGRLSVAVSNLTAKPLTVNLSVKGRIQQGQTPGGRVELAPFAAGTLKVDLHNIPWALDVPLELVGMNGRPSAAGGGTFDLRRTTSLHVFVNRDGEEHAFAVRSVVVSGDGAAVKTLSAKTFLPFVDRYGQFRHDDWPGKVHSDAELAAQRAAEERWLEANAEGPVRGLDVYGGWAEGPQLKATGFFRTEKVDGKWWLVDPEGRLFFSHGVDCVGFGAATTAVDWRREYFAELPAADDPLYAGCWGRVTSPAAHGFYKDPAHLPYATFNFSRANLVRKYGKDWAEHCRSLAHRRIRAWGLNTVANWSDERVYSLRKTPYTLCLGTSGTPRLKGSTGWWGALPDPFDPEFERIFRKRAQAAAAKMRDDPWCLGVFVDNELSWNDEPRMEDVSEKYFQVISSVLKEELPNHLYLGCRIAWGKVNVFRQASKYCDVVSVNMYAKAPYRDLGPDCVDKPMLNGEFHFGALDRGMFHTGLVATGSQAERAAAYRDYVNACLDHPRYVGTHWFQWQDQALTGRSDGENYQIGFLTVTDAPYPELVEAARDVAAKMYRRRYGDR